MAEKEEKESQDVGQDKAWVANLKKIFEGEMNETARNRLIFELMAGNVMSNLTSTISSINSAMANTVNSVSKYCDLAMKQCIEHEKLGTDRQWNVDEQGYTVEKILRAPFWQDLAQAIAVAVASALKPESE